VINFVIANCSGIPDTPGEHILCVGDIWDCEVLEA
jgi:hypothetical protein